MILCKSCDALDEVPEGSVALTVTSPPYWNAIDYARHAADPRQSYRTRKPLPGFRTYEEYLAWLVGVFRTLLPKTVPGGFCAVVVGTILDKQMHIPFPFDLAHELVRAGWRFHDAIIWHKVAGGLKRAGTTILHPHPGFYYPNIMTEYVLVFRRPGHRHWQQDERTRITVESPLFTHEVANNVWHIPPVPSRTIPHPCPFPEEIPYRLITLYTRPGDLVLDPFVGSGQTTKVARALGRRYFAYDIIPQYVELAKARTEQALHLRSHQLIPHYARIPIRGDPAHPLRSTD